MYTLCIIGVMTLADYIRRFPYAQRASVRRHIAATLGISEVYVRSMCNGNKTIPGKYALGIERATQGLVSRHVISPTLYPCELA
jgi:DNA-binding transcriptional regulator YdaS (Cro superfamily)